MNLEFCVLDHTDLGLMRDAAECLAETFTGVQLGNGDFIQEPISAALQLRKDVHQEWIMGYLGEVAAHGLTMIAKDKQTGRVVGVFAGENYDPYLETPVFEGDFTPMNDVIRFLEELDHHFKDLYETKLESSVTTDQLVHMFMLGVRTEEDRKLIARELIDLALEVSRQRGFRAMFGETTNPKSRKLFERLGFYMPEDAQGRPLEKKYAQDEVFRVISEDVATECNLLYLELDPACCLR